HQRCLLFVGDRQQATPQHFEGDRIEGHSTTLRFRDGSTSIRAPGPMTVVDSRSSMMAGPSNSVPTVSRYRSYTGTGRCPSHSGKYTGRSPFFAVPAAPEAERSLTAGRG